MGQNYVKRKISEGEVKKLRRQVSFSEREIKDWYREFVQSTSKHHNDLFLTEEEFVKVYNSVYSGQGAEFAKHVYRTFDLDGDGKVNFREFLIGLSFSGSSNFEKKLSWAFRVYDVQNTGYITRTDMKQIVQSVFKMLGPLDVKGITQDPEQMADDMFRQLDTNGDQQISWEEFRDGASKNPTVLELLQCAPPDGEKAEAV